MKIKEDLPKLTEDELRFRDNPKIIKFKIDDYIGLFSKGDCIRTITSFMYKEKTRRDKYIIMHDGIESQDSIERSLIMCNEIENPDDDQHNLYVRQKKLQGGYNSDITHHLKNSLFIEALMKEYNINQYLLVPAYYKYYTYVTGNILVSVNEFKKDFPSINTNNISYLYSESNMPSIGFIDYYIRPNECAINILMKLNYDIKNDYYLSYCSPKEEQKIPYNFNIKYYHPSDSIELLRKKMKKISLSHFNVDE